MTFKYDQFTGRKGEQRMNRLLDEVISEVRGTKKPAFDSADDLCLCIQPDTQDTIPYTTEQLIADCKLAMQFKSPRERRQIAKDCKRLQRQLEEEPNKEFAKAGIREDNNRLNMVSNAGNHAHDSAYRRLNSLYTEYHHGIAVRTYRG